MLENIEPKYRLPVLVGLIFGSILAIIGLSYLLMSSSHSHNIVPQSNMPDVNNFKSTNVSTSDHFNMVNARGYFFQYDIGFIPIIITSLENVVDKDSKAPSVTGHLVLVSEYANLILDYLAFDKTTTLKTLGIELPSQEEEEKANRRKICNIVPDMNVQYDAPQRFACTRREVRTCVDEANPKERVGELVLESFEVELGGDPKILAEGKFSKEPIKSGCRL